MAKKQVGVSLRKPPPPADLDAFVASGPQSDVRDLAPSPAPMREVVVATSNGRQLREVTVYLPVDLARRLSIACVESDKDVSNYIATKLEEELAPKALPQKAAPKAKPEPLRVWVDQLRSMSMLLRSRLGIA
jgi:hypothetical protein